MKRKTYFVLADFLARFNIKILLAIQIPELRRGYAYIFLK